jgi:branched-chain amino acid transport system permease protein
MGYLLTILATFFTTLQSVTGIHGVFSLAGIFFLGSPVVMKLSIYALAIAQRAGVPPHYAFLIALGVAIVAGILFAYLFVKVSADSFAVLGLAALLASEALMRSWDDVTNGVLGISGIQRPDLFSSLPSLAMMFGVVTLLIILLQYVLLTTWVGRSIRAYKQNEIALEALGRPTKKIAQGLIIFTSFVYGITGAFIAWRVQFVDPQIAGMPYLIEIVTMGILALSPRIRSLVWAALFVTFFPEILRFLSLPVTMMGYARLLLYSLALLYLIRKLSPKLALSNRQI